MICKYKINGDCSLKVFPHPTDKTCLLACKQRDGDQLPSLPTMARNFARAVVKHVGNPTKRSDNEVERILAICAQCPNFVIVNGHKRCRHKKCGCFLETKVSWASENCPEDRWYPKFDEPKISPFFDANKDRLNILGLFKNKGVFIIANGPSFKDVDWQSLKQPGIITFGMNNGAHIFRPNLWSGQDNVKKFMPDLWEDPNIIKFADVNARNTIYEGNKVLRDCPNLYFISRKSDFNAEQWFSMDHISWGLSDTRCSLLAVIHMCYFLGFKRIYLLGVDWEMSNEKKYFFDQDRTPGAIAANNNLYRAQEQYLADIPFKRAGIDVFNCTVGSKLKVFPTMDLNVAINKEKLDVSGSTAGRYDRPDKAIIYYTDNRMEGTILGDAVKKRLLDTGLPIISVSHRPIDFGTNIVVDKKPCGRSIIEQVIIGLEATDAKTVYLCEHDCLYHPSHFDLEARDVIAYNKNMWRLMLNGYTKHPDTSPVLSACVANRKKLLDAMQLKLKKCGESTGPGMYEPGRGKGPGGSSIKCLLLSSEQPCVDVRHGNNFTVGRALIKKHKTMVLEPWGDYQQLRKELGL